MRNESFTWDLSSSVCIKVRAKTVPKSDKHPIGVYFAVMGFVQGKKIIRIDNAKHKGKLGTHIHFFKKEFRKETAKVEYLEEIRSPEEAINYVQAHIEKSYKGFL